MTEQTRRAFLVTAGAAALVLPSGALVASDAVAAEGPYRCSEVMIDAIRYYGAEVPRYSFLHSGSQCIVYEGGPYPNGKIFTQTLRMTRYRHPKCDMKIGEIFYWNDPEHFGAEFVAYIIWDLKRTWGGEVI